MKKGVEPICECSVRPSFSLIAFPTETAVGDVMPDVIFSLGLLYGPVVMVIFLLACYAISRYDISRAKFVDTVVKLGES